MNMGNIFYMVLMTNKDAIFIHYSKYITLEYSNKNVRYNNAKKIMLHFHSFISSKKEK